MEKSNHRYKNFDIPVEELGNFVEPINATIPLDYCITIKFIKNDSMLEYNNVLDVLYGTLYNEMPTLKKIIWDNECNRKMYKPVSYTPHDNMPYDFRLHPVDILNNIFKSLNLSYHIPFINLDEHDYYFKEYVINCMSNLKASTSKTDEYKKMADEIINNLDNFLSLYKIPINIEKYGIPKDVLFNIAVKSLDLYEERKEEKYLVIPDEYYEHVSDMERTAWPHSVKVKPDGLLRTPTIWFNDFNDIFNEILRRDYSDVNYHIDHKKHSIKKSSIIVGWEILSRGRLVKHLREINQKVQAVSHVDYEWFQKMFESKTNYYLNSPYKTIITGKYGLDGYLGLSYSNEYLVFDKFYNREVPDMTKRTILTHSEAIYALPSDKLSCTRYSKQGIIKEKEEDKRIRKINHTINNSYLKRLDNVIYGPNVSTSTLEEELEKESKKILVKRRNV